MMVLPDANQKVNGRALYMYIAGRLSFCCSARARGRQRTQWGHDMSSRFLRSRVCPLDRTGSIPARCGLGTDFSLVPILSLAHCYRDISSFHACWSVEIPSGQSRNQFYD